MTKTRSRPVNSVNQHYGEICTEYYRKASELVKIIKEINDKDEKKELSADDTSDDHETWIHEEGRVLKKLKANEIPGVDVWIDEITQTEIHHDIAANIYTLKFTRPSSDNRPDIVGTSGTTVVKIMTEDSYDFIKTEDLMGVGINAINAAGFSTIVKKYYPDDAKKVALFQQWLQEQLKKYKEDIAEKCFLDINEMRELRRPERQEEFAAYVKQRRDLAELINENLWEKLAESLKELDGKNLHIPFENIVKDIKQAGIDVLAHNGRPNIIKFKEFNPDGANQEHMMMSAQFTQGKKTRPSSSRNRKLGDEKYLSNHVNDVTGHIVKNDKGMNEVKVDLVVDGHSSNPPIKESDELTRRYLAYLSLQEEVAQHAQHIAESATVTGNTITVSLSTMLMLSPIKHKKVEHLRGNTSESAQLGDTYFAYQMLQRNQPFKAKIMIGGKEKEIEIHVDLNLMNMPVNLGTMTNVVLRSELQDKINNQGFEKYIADIDLYLDSKSEIVKNNFFSPKSIPSDKKNLKLQGTSKDLSANYTKYKTQMNSTEVKEAIKELNEIRSDETKAELIRLSNAMEIELEQYAKATDEKTKENHKKEYHSLREKIKKIDSKIQQKEAELMQARQKAFKDPQTKMAYDATQRCITNLLNNLDEKKDDEVDAERIALRETLLLHQRFLLAQRLFYNEEYLDSKNTYRFHILYLLTNEEVGRFIEANCKSGKDRTGWLRVCLLASIAFKLAYGRDPNFDAPKEKEAYDRYFSASAMELSASLDASMYNGNSKGLQVNPALTNNYISIDIGKYCATLGKDTFKGLLSISNPIKEKQKAALRSSGDIFYYDQEERKHGQADSIIVPVHEKSLQKPILTAAEDNFSYRMEAIHAQIKFFQQQDFDYVIAKNENDRLMLVKDNQRYDKPLNPIHKNEATIQALRYLRGMLLIHNHVDDRLKPDFLVGIQEVFNEFVSKNGQVQEFSAQDTERLVMKFADLINDHLKVTKGSKQLTMARDLGILLETHPDICTISRHQNQLTIEKASLIKISDKYYDEQFFDLGNRIWFTKAKKKAGFNEGSGTTWLENFFQDKENLKQLKKLGVPATPSSRWLPLPANSQRVETEVRNLTGADLTDISATSHSSFIRMGIVSSYEINNSKEQKELAKAQVREIILSQLEERIKNYKNLYGLLADENFYICYQTLLSPHKKEAYIPYQDNNARFVELAKEVIHELENDESKESLKNVLQKKHQVKITFYQTNSSINHRGNWVSAKDYEEDKKIRLEKIEAAKKLELLSEKSVPPQLAQEIKRRISAAKALELLLENKPPYDRLENHQRNIMMGALEFHVAGSQCLTLLGCKSARDRTALCASAIKVMQENPSAMSDWELLNKGIVDSLQEGHSFRALDHHSAVVKVSDVHKEFMEELPPPLQRNIKELKIFSKNINNDANSKKEYKENWEQIKDRVNHWERRMDEFTSTTMDKEERLAFIELKKQTDNLSKQLEKAEHAYQNKYPLAANAEHRNYITRLDKLNHTKGRIVERTQVNISSLDSRDAIERKVNEILHEKKIQDPTKGQLLQANTVTAHSNKISQVCNTYKVGKHVIKSVAITSEHGAKREVFYNKKEIPYLVGKEHLANRNQDAKLKALYEAIVQAEEFRKNFAEAFLENLKKEGRAKGLTEIEILKQAESVLPKKMEELVTQISGFPPKIANLIMTYHKIQGYHYLRISDGNSQSFSPQEKHLEKMKKMLVDYKDFLPDRFDPAALIHQHRANTHTLLGSHGSSFRSSIPGHSPDYGKH